MLRARLSNGVFILGIDAENVKRLKDGKPILVSLAELGGHDDVMIMYGDTLLDIQDELEQASGSKLPDPKTITKTN
jgi:hypothetical protein